MAPITYTISTVDSLEYKRLICGRTDDITKLLGHISAGHSVALFGERRIGKTSLPWPQRAKWAGAITLFLLAVWIYIHVHPTSQAHPFNFPDGVVTIRIPATLEQGEQGVAVVSFHNTSQTQPYSITLSLASTDIQFKQNV